MCLELLRLGDDSFNIADGANAWAMKNRAVAGMILKPTQIGNRSFVGMGRTFRRRAVPG